MNTNKDLETASVDSTRTITRGNRHAITRAYIRHYSDNLQTTAYVEWSDGSRTEGNPNGEHMQALMNRALREGLKIERETW